MTNFHDKQPGPEPGGDATTFELGRDSWRDGIVVQLDAGFNVHQCRAVFVELFDRVGPRGPIQSQLTSPGWWAIQLGAVLDDYGHAHVQRAIGRSVSRHVLVDVDSYRVGERPRWPMVRFAPSMPWLDLRTEAALRHGPSTVELAMYQASLGEGARPSLADLLYQFDHGVLEWEPGEPVGRARGIRAAGA